MKVTVVCVTVVLRAGCVQDTRAVVTTRPTIFIEALTLHVKVTPTHVSVKHCSTNISIHSRINRQNLRT